MKGKGGIYMAILVLFSFVYNINKFFEVTTGYITTEQNVTVATVKVRFFSYWTVKFELSYHRDRLKSWYVVW